MNCQYYCPISHFAFQITPISNVEISIFTNIYCFVILKFPFFSLSNHTLHFYWYFNLSKLCIILYLIKDDKGHSLLVLKFHYYCTISHVAFQSRLQITPINYDDFFTFLFSLFTSPCKAYILLILEFKFSSNLSCFPFQRT